jgi:hypothetical protein
MDSKIQDKEPMRQVFHVQNTSGHRIQIRLEPWAERYWVQAGVDLEIILEGPPGLFEFDYGFDEIVVYAWPGAVMKVLSKGEDIAGPGTERTEFPEPPPGMSTKKMVNMLFGNLEKDKLAKKVRKVAWKIVDLLLAGH